MQVICRQIPSRESICRSVTPFFFFAAFRFHDDVEVPCVGVVGDSLEVGLPVLGLAVEIRALRLEVKCHYRKARVVVEHGDQVLSSMDNSARFVAIHSLTEEDLPAGLNDEL